METRELNIVTGAFSYTGRYITQKLLSMGKTVKTLTGHPNRQNPFGNQVSIVPFNFDNPNKLVVSLQNATTLYNTYWIRFPYGQITFDKAIENTKTLIKACEEAGVRKIVHISVTNASEDSPIPYFRGKGIIEKAIINSNLSYAIIRPAIIFGLDDILINNIAWFLRRFPIFAIPGTGNYRLQPIFAKDIAEIAVISAHCNENIIVDAVGPEIYTFYEFIQLIADKVHSKAKIIYINPKVALLFLRLVGYIVNDIVLTQDEVKGLMSNFLISKGPPTGQTRLSKWLCQNACCLGKKYTSDLARHYLTKVC